MRSKAPSFSDTANVIRHFSGNKKSYGLNVQGLCGRNLRFVGMAAHAPGATNDSVAWQRSKVSTATENLPDGFFVIGDNAYANTEHLMTPYAGRNQSAEKDSYNFVLCQCRIRVEQAFGMLVGRFGLLWRPLKMGYAKQTSVIRAIFHLHNFCQDERVAPVMECEDSSSHRPRANNWVLGEDWVPEGSDAPRMPGDTALRTKYVGKVVRANIRRPVDNVLRNSGRSA